LLIALWTAACSTKARDGEPQPAPAPNGAAEAPADEAMCKEHGVLEAVCTKCNPKLIPVFQAKGDWCAEHGFPESFCPLCHPERGGRPKTDVTSDGAPETGTKVRFKTKEIAQRAGIETEPVAVRPGGSAVLATARLAYDATKLARVNARAPGAVRALKVDVGTRVKKGDALAVIDSAEVGAGRARLQAARTRRDVAEASHARLEKLAEEGIVAKKSELEALQELEAAKSEYAVIAATLAVLGSSGGGGSGYTLTAPLAGVVTERTATIGGVVDTEQVLFEIVDTSSMWAELDVPEAELGRIAVDQKVTVTLEGNGGRQIEGAISYLAPSVDPHTRTARARVPLANPDGALRANMYGEARIAVVSTRPTVMVPRSAVQRARSVFLVFVRVREGEYEARRVELGIREAERIEVVKGVKPGEEVVTQGSFLLKTETLKDSIGAGCCEAD